VTRFGSLFQRVVYNGKKEAYPWNKESSSRFVLAVTGSAGAVLSGTAPSETTDKSACSYKSEEYSKSVPETPRLVCSAMCAETGQRVVWVFIPDLMSSSEPTTIRRFMGRGIHSLFTVDILLYTVPYF